MIHRRNISALAVVLVAVSGVSAETWRWQHPHPTGAPLNAITMADRGRCVWAVGEAGTILASRDSGFTWQVQTSPRRVNLTAAAALGANEVWAVGDSGVMLVTHDGGARWEAQQTGVFVALRGIAMPDAHHGWAVGEGGLILSASTDGRLWIPQHQQHGASLNGVAAFDGSHALVVGWRPGVPHGDAVILRTDDAGQTWTEQPFGPAHRFTAVWAERGGERAWAVAAPEMRNAPPLIVESADGGLHWKMHEVNATGALFGILAQERTITAVGIAEMGRAWVVQSVDGGESWRWRFLSSPVRLLGVQGLRPDRTIAVGEGGAILGPADLGTRRLPELIRSNVRAVAFTNPRRGCAVGDDGLILCTHDSGAHWSKPASALPGNYHGVVWTSRDVAYAVAEGGLIMRTLDGGATWNMRPSPTESDLTAIAAQREDVWVVGVDGFVMRSDDRGNSWTPAKKPTSETLVAVEITPEGAAVVLTATGSVWKTTDGGARWSEHRPGLRGQATALAAPGPGCILIAGTTDNPPENVLFRSDDGGRTWARHGVPVRVEGMAFSTPDEGAVVGEHAVLMTSDGGRTWRRTDVPTNAVLRAVDAAGGLVWAAGDFASIIRLAP